MYTIVSKEQADTAYAVSQIMTRFYRDHDRHSKFSQSDIDSGLASWIIGKALTAKNAADKVWYDLEDQYEAAHDGGSLGALTAARNSLRDQGMCYCALYGTLQCDVCDGYHPDCAPAWLFCEMLVTEKELDQHLADLNYATVLLQKMLRSQYTDHAYAIEVISDQAHTVGLLESMFTCQYATFRRQQGF